MDDATTGAAEVCAVLDALEAAGCWVSLEGGWAVDALLGRQTRPHRDVDRADLALLHRLREEGR